MEKTITDLHLPVDEFLIAHEGEFSDFDQLQVLIKKLEEEKQHLIEKISLENADSQVSQVTEKLNTVITELNAVISDTETIIHGIDTNLSATNDVSKQLQNFLDDMNMVETKVQYTKVVQHITKLNEGLEKEYLNNDDEKCVTLFANICEVGRILHESDAVHLKAYIKEVLVYWHEVLKERFVSALDDILKTIKWPFVNANFSLITPTQANITKLQMIVEYLLQIEMPEEHQTPQVVPGLLADFPPLCLPIHYLLQPLRKRFSYHFYGGRQTNRADKPEWYFTQILSWVRDHLDFVTKWIQPIIDKLGLHHIDAKLEFMRGLVQLAVEKLHSDLPNVRYDDFTFSHSIDEALGFDKELRETYFYPTSEPSILSVLTQGVNFNQWIKMERKYALEKMDSMLNDLSTAFDPLAAEEEEFKITICADTFVALLQTVTERYESLPQPGHRLQFLDLQIELLDNFRIRLLQLANSVDDRSDLMEGKIASIANTTFYIENVLLDWGNMLHYLNLYYYKEQLETVENKSHPSTAEKDGGLNGEIETDTVFADTLSLYRHMRKDLMHTLADAVVQEAQQKAHAYARERWSTMLPRKDLREFSLTPSACPMFEILARRLHQLQKSLAVKLFTIVWRYIAQELDNYLFEDLVLDNRFNEGGVMQFKYDVQRNLFPLFSQFSEKPENYFLQVKESCELLNITKGTAILLRETLIALEGATGVEDRRGMALREVGVTNFTPQMAVQILNRRIDLRNNHRVPSID